MTKILHRSIAITMSLIAIVVMGCIALRNNPVSLMPDIDVPQIMMRANIHSYLIREIGRDVISPLRG